VPEPTFHTTLDYMVDRFDALGCRMALKAQTPGELLQWQHELRVQLRRLIGLDTMRTAPLEARLTERVKLDGYWRERVEIQTEPGVIMPLYVLVPDNLKAGERRPCILAPHGHGSAGKMAIAGRRDIPAIADMIDIGALIAPRLLVIETGTHDHLSGSSELGNVLPQVATTHRAYRLLGHDALPLHDVFEGGHRWNGVQVIPFLKANLGLH
jgi:hypothetical protein